MFRKKINKEVNEPYRWQKPDPGYPGGGNHILPNSTAVLILGILSIGMCWMFGFFSFIFAVVSLVMASRAEKEYKRQPGVYTVASYRNMAAGKTCAVIGLCLGVFSLLFFVFVLLFFGSALLAFLAFL